VKKKNKFVQKMTAKFNPTAFVYGVVGDACLQVIDRNTSKGEEWGLHSYFQKHGPFESLIIAGLMTSGTLFLYDTLFKERSVGKLFILGACLDVFFRNAMPMESLGDYYRHLHPLMSIFWAGAPAAVMVNF
jgi:hypothetical protein